jgi:tricorn protease interacting factor F2/3
MKSWLEKGGFPLVKVREEGGWLRISQQKFTYLGNDDQYIWQIPLFIEQSGKKRKLLLKEKERRMRYKENMKINGNGEGYYRLLFEGTLIDRMLGSGSSPEFVMKLIDDYYAFLMSGAIDLQQFVSLVEKLRERDEYSIVLRLESILAELNTIIDSDALNTLFVNYLREKLPKFSDSDEENSKVVLERILTALALHDKNFRSTEKLKINDYPSVMAEERNAVLISSAIEEFNKDRLWGMLKSPENDMELVRVMHAMAHLPKNDEITNFLDFVKSKPEYRANFIYPIFEAITSRNYRKDVWGWMSKNLATIREVFAGSSTVSRLIEDLIAIAGIGNRPLVDQFISREKVPEAARAVKNGLEKLEINERLIQRALKS